MSRSLLLATVALALVTTTSCVSVSVEEYAPPAPLAEPLIESVMINGPVFSDLRSGGYDRSTTSSFGSAQLVDSYGNSSPTLNSSDHQTTVRQGYERFDNRSLERHFVRLVEDLRVARKVLPQHSGSPARYRFDARVSVTGDTGAGKITWNVVNSLLMLSLLPTPFLGNSLVTVEVRVYDQDEYAFTTTGQSRTSWMLPGLWGLAHTPGRAERESLNRAGSIAIAKAVEGIVDHGRGARVSRE
ncbi:MAG: hypothetical protein AAF488_15870 [Planctomycetota bacterium]